MILVNKYKLFKIILQMIVIFYFTQFVHMDIHYIITIYWFNIGHFRVLYISALILFSTQRDTDHVILSDFYKD